MNKHRRGTHFPKRQGDTRPLGVAAFWIRIIGGAGFVIATIVFAQTLPEKQRGAAYIVALLLAARVALYIRRGRT